MSSDLLKVSPQNLPTYVYDLTADIAFAHRDGVFKLKFYTFSHVRVVVNQPLRKGDSLLCNAYYPGNSSTEIIPHLVKKNVLNGAEKELRHYCGCIIGDLLLEYAPGIYKNETCAEGRCTIFIQLSACETGDKYKELDDFGSIDEISREQYAEWQEALKEYQAADNIEWWKARVGNWDERVEYIGQESDFLLLY